MSYWKQFILYTLRTGLLDEDSRQRHYGIQFTPTQLQIIWELAALLDTYHEDRDMDEWSLDSSDDESDEELNGVDRINDDEFDADDDDDKNDETYIPRFIAPPVNNGGNDDEDTNTSIKVKVAEKILQLSIEYITQRFPSGEDKNSPLIHFSSVLGITVKTATFRDPYNYTSYVAGLLWVCRIFVLERALPSRKYVTLDWSARTEYEDHGWRFEELRRKYLVDGCFYPVNDLLRLLAFGKATVKAVGRPGQIFWDPDYEGLRIKDIHLRLNDFRKFVGDILDSLVETMEQQLFFGMTRPGIDFDNIKDVMMTDTPRFSFVTEPENKLPDGKAFMIDWMKHARVELQLIDENGVWNQERVRKYLMSKERFLKLLMLGIVFL
jgi:hypothetical protein